MRKLFWFWAAGAVAVGASAGGLFWVADRASRDPQSGYARTLMVVTGAGGKVKRADLLERRRLELAAGRDKEAVSAIEYSLEEAEPTPRLTLSGVIELKGEVEPTVITVPEQDDVRPLIPRPEGAEPPLARQLVESGVYFYREHAPDTCPAVMPYCHDDDSPKPGPMPYCYEPTNNEAKPTQVAIADEPAADMTTIWWKLWKKLVAYPEFPGATEEAEPTTPTTEPTLPVEDYHKQNQHCPYTGAPYNPGQTQRKSPTDDLPTPRTSEDEESGEPREAARKALHKAMKVFVKPETTESGTRQARPHCPSIDTMEYRRSDDRIHNFGYGPF